MINIANILKDYPKGTKLYSPAYGDVEFSGFCSGYICVTKGCTTYSFNEYGIVDNGGECMLFPSKDIRDWEVFEEIKEVKTIWYPVSTKPKRRYKIFLIRINNSEMIMPTYSIAIYKSGRFIDNKTYSPFKYVTHWAYFPKI